MGIYKGFGLFFVISVVCQLAIGQDLCTSDTIPLSPQVIRGTLKNGLTFYIIDTDTSTGKLEMHLVVKAGMNNEKADQLELSHLLEHLVFTGTVNFSNANDFFESRGLRRAWDINASTGFQKTTYDLLNIPSIDTLLIRQGLLFLSDCADGIVINEKKVDSERGTILSEMNLSEEFKYTMRDQYIMQIIGDQFFYPTVQMRKKNVKEFKIESLLSYYNTWYRPDMQAVIVVGDLNGLNVEYLITSTFSKIKKKSGSVVVKKVGMKIDKAPKHIVVTNASESNIEILMEREFPYFDIITKSDFDRQFVMDVFNEMVAERFRFINRSSDSPVSFMSMNLDRKLNTWGVFYGGQVLNIQVKGDSIKRAYKAAMTELERIKRYGFTDDEVKRAKNSLRTKMLSAYSSSRSLSAMCQDHFVNNDAFPSRYCLESLVDQISYKLNSEFLGDFTRGFCDFENVNTVVLGPESKRAALPTSNDLKQWKNEIQRSNVGPYKKGPDAERIELPELADTLKCVNPISKRRDTLIGTTELLFPGGLRVILKPVLGERKIWLEGFRRGGASSYSERDYYSAYYASSIVGSHAVGPLTRGEFDDFMRQHGISTSYPYILKDTEGVRAIGDSNGVEALFQSIYLFFLTQSKDFTFFDSWMADKRDYIINKHYSAILYDTISSDLTSAGFFRHREMSLSDMHKLKPDRAYEIYLDKFSSISNYTFIVTGDFDEISVEKLISKYLANIAIVNGNRFPKPPNERVRSKKVTRVIYEEKDINKAEVQIHYLGNYAYNLRNNIMLQIISRSLQNILFKRLREDAGGTYAVSVSLDNFKNKTGLFDLRMGFQCFPDDAEKMSTYTVEQLFNLKKIEIDKFVFNVALSSELQDLKSSMANGDFWLGYLKNQIQNDADIHDINLMEGEIRNIKPRDVLEFAKEIFRDESLLKFIMMPKEIGRS